MGVRFVNIKEKYAFDFSVFNGKFQLRINKTGQDKTKLAECVIPMDTLYAIYNYCRELPKRPVEAILSTTMNKWDNDSKSFQIVSIISFKKTSEMTYNWHLETKIGGEMKKFYVPITTEAFGNDLSPNEKSEKALGFLLWYIQHGAMAEAAASKSNIELFYIKSTLGNMATKMGVPVVGPKSGGGKSFNKPTPKPAPEPEDDYAPAPASDDDIPF